MEDPTRPGDRTTLLPSAETRLPDDFVDVAVAQQLRDGANPEDLARTHLDSPMAWAALAEHRLDAGDEVGAYACARTGYHRGLDALRRSGWKGHGLIPAAHEPNRGFLRALAMLGQTSRLLGDHTEAERIREFLATADPSLQA